MTILFFFIKIFVLLLGGEQRCTLEALWSRQYLVLFLTSQKKQSDCCHFETGTFQADHRRAFSFRPADEIKHGANVSPFFTLIRKWTTSICR